MKIIFAQGNPGSEYQKTRHNVGFMALDLFAHQKGVQFQPKTKFFADVAEIHNGNEKILLVKPTTFYNETGTSARAIADFYKITPGDILVIHDDLALPFGTLRTREKGSDAGNNGIKSLNAHLGQDYARIRVGIWTELADIAGASDFVLSRFTSNEMSSLDSDILPKIGELVEDFMTGRYETTSHTLISK